MAPMIAFIQLPYKRTEPEPRDGVRSLIVALVLGVVLCSQLGLLVWAMLR